MNPEFRHTDLPSLRSRELKELGIHHAEPNVELEIRKKQYLLSTVENDLLADKIPPRPKYIFGLENSGLFLGKDTVVKKIGFFEE